jgi:hypothetical protein
VLDQPKPERGSDITAAGDQHPSHQMYRPVGFSTESTSITLPSSEGAARMRGAVGAGGLGIGLRRCDDITLHMRSAPRQTMCMSRRPEADLDRGAIFVVKASTITRQQRGENAVKRG